jgi:hypothetical protein
MDEFIKYAFGAGGPAAVAALGWWLSGRFRNIERTQAAVLYAHENEDQKRHEENLLRFSDIKEALARLGYRNGSS